MYWFSGVNNHNKDSYFNYIKMYKVAVFTAKQTNPNIKPVLILDGDEDDHIRELENLGVQIFKHTSSFFNSLKEHYKDNTTAFGAFLRVDIPLICSELSIEDDYVLYTDNDVMFISDVSGLIEFKSNLIMCCGEFTKQSNFHGMNSGVMWMNWKLLLNFQEDFVNFIKQNLHKFQVYDQDAYKQYFREKLTLLNYEFNYKPYWGHHDDIKILHFHGPKPTQTEKELESFPFKQLITPYFREMCQIFNENYDKYCLLNTQG